MSLWSNSDCKGAVVAFTVSVLCPYKFSVHNADYRLLGVYTCLCSCLPELWPIALDLGGLANYQAPSLEGRSFIFHYWGCQFSHTWLEKGQWIISFKAKSGENGLRMRETEGIIWSDAYKVCNFCVSGSQPNAPKSDLTKLISLFSFFSKSKNDRTFSYINEESNDPEPRKLRCLDVSCFTKHLLWVEHFKYFR